MKTAMSSSPMKENDLSTTLEGLASKELRSSSLGNLEEWAAVEHIPRRSVLFDIPADKYTQLKKVFQAVQTQYPDRVMPDVHFVENALIFSPLNDGYSRRYELESSSDTETADVRFFGSRISDARKIINQWLNDR